MAFFSMWQKVSNFGALLGILGVSINSVMGSAYEAHVAFGAIAITCIVVLGYVAWRVRVWQQTIYPKGYRPISTFVRYMTTDGKSITHETFRHIQIKHTYLAKIEHRYNWSGTKAPVVSSDLQSLGAEAVDAATGFNVRCVHFERPRFYNETEVVHLRSECDDSDQMSSPFVSMLIDTPVTIIHFRVELLHCGKANHGGMKATIERKLQTKPGDVFDRLGEVAFDVNSRSFSHLLKHPEAGYVYRMRWERPQLQAPRRNGHKKPGVP